MKVAIIGAAGKAGSKIAEQALANGHDLTAIVRPGSAERVVAGCAILEAEWEEFVSHMPYLGELYDEERLESAYMT